MADTLPAGRGTVREAPPPARSITELIASGTLDAELAATLWMLLEGRVPVIVSGAAPGAGATTLLGALLDFLPPGARMIELAGADETFDWLPQASELGWRRPSAEHPYREGPPVRPASTVLLIPALSDAPSHTWGEAARVALRAASIGYGLAATIGGGALSEVVAALRRSPVGLSADEISRLGVVLVVRRAGPGEAPRVVAAHYVRPVSRDEHGHIQRLGPAVLATWDPAGDRFEHFGWGITPELAIRVGRRAGDFEIEVDRRRDLLAGLAADGIVEVDAVRAAIADDRATIEPVAALD